MGQRQMLTPEIRNRIIIAVFAVTAISCLVSYKLGLGYASKALPRLMQAWPNWKELPESDRNLISELAYSCKLENRPKEVSATVDCLREGLSNPNTTFPAGFDAATAERRLRQLEPQRIGASQSE